MVNQLARSSARPNLVILLTIVLTPVVAPAAWRLAEDELRRPRQKVSAAAESADRRRRCTAAFTAIEPMLRSRYRRALAEFERIVRDLAEEVGS